MIGGVVKVLIVEDSEHLRNYVARALKRAGYAVDLAADGPGGLWHAQSYSYDVILLDIMLPGLDGLSLLRQLREAGSNTHILLLTAKDRVEDRVRGLTLGADDYLVKPFDMEELVARVQALTRRAYEKKAPEQRIGSLCIDTIRREVSVDGVVVGLARREYLLLEYLVSRKGEVVSRPDIEEHIYDENADLMSNAVNSTVSMLRKKLGSHGRMIETRRGLGYVFSGEDGR